MTTTGMVASIQARTSAVLEEMRLQGIPFISVLTDPVYGGVSASLAMLGDLNVAEPRALVGFAGPRASLTISSSSNGRSLNNTTFFPE